MSVTSAGASARVRATSAAASATVNMAWLMGALVMGLLLLYFVGFDEGATSVFGDTMVVHEFVHDSRHFLGFPCH